jgi:glycosyltransferase involved in cell wall biosynthesis
MLSVVVPAFNEESGIAPTLQGVREALGAAGIEHQIIVVDDGSTDRTAEIARQMGAQVVAHPTNMGYGAALRDGILAARHEIVAITDADGTYPVQELARFLTVITEQGYDMCVGVRGGSEIRRGLLAYPARLLFRALSEFATGTRIPDINSGLRVFRKKIVLDHLSTFGTGFSFSTTLTLVALLNGHSIKFWPIEYRPRAGRSKVRLLRDSLRAAQILVEAILMHNPIKAFLVLAGLTLAAGLAAAGLSLAPWGRLADRLGLLGTGLIVASVLIVGLGFVAVVFRRLLGIPRAPAPGSPKPERVETASPAQERDADRR